jgi:hypothetical protein
VSTRRARPKPGTGPAERAGTGVPVLKPGTGPAERAGTGVPVLPIPNTKRRPQEMNL